MNGARAPLAAVSNLAERSESRRPLVEILHFDGCPNRAQTESLVIHVARQLGIEVELRQVNVVDQEAAERVRFLNSPTVRVDGPEIEPGADERTEYVLSRRLSRTRSGLSGQPDETWLHNALRCSP